MAHDAHPQRVSDPLVTHNDTPRQAKPTNSRSTVGDDTLDLLLIGKAGQGKSSVGNSILGHRKFPSSTSGEPKFTNNGWREVDGRVVKVTDTTGVQRTSPGQGEEFIRIASRVLGKAVADCPNGFHALVIVFSFPPTFREEDVDALELLKSILGEDVLKTRGVCVCSFGDEYPEDGTSFSSWVRNQTGILGDLLRECNYRCLLFDNVTEDPRLAKQQVSELLSLVDSLDPTGQRFTHELFNLAEKQRKRLMAEGQAAQVREDVVKDFELVLQRLEKMAHNVDDEKVENDMWLTMNMNSIGRRMARAKRVDNMKIVLEKFAAVRTDIEARRTPTQPSFSFLDDSDDFSDDEDEEEELDVFKDEEEKEDGEGSRFRNEEEKENNNDNDEGEEEENRKSGIEIPRRTLCLLSEAREAFDREVALVHTGVNDLVAFHVAEEIRERQRSCFPADSTVIVRGGSSVPVEDLEIGDQVLVRTDSGEMLFEDVYMFAHRDAQACGAFLMLETQSCKLNVSPDHLVYCRVNGDVETCTPARDVNLQTELLVFISGTLLYERVQRFGLKAKRGFFCPLTLSGTVVVDQALVSCYVDSGVFGHKASHAFLWPFRLLYKVSPSLLASASRPSQVSGIPMFARAAMKLV